jgi:c-di-GMP-binding flagellar brake protein YcgR
MTYSPIPLRETPPIATADSKRIWARYASSRPLPRRLDVADSRTPLEAWILDLSAGGIGLLVNQPQPLGTLLHVELETCPAVAPLKLWAHVVHCQAAEVEGEFRLGCQFVTALSEGDLQVLLQ